MSKKVNNIIPDKINVDRLGYRFGTPVKLTTEVAGADFSALVKWFSKGTRKVFVTLYEPCPSYPLPQGEKCTSDERDVWKFAFGEKPENHPLLQGIILETYALDNDAGGTWLGCMFVFETKDKSRFDQLDEAAKILFDYLNDRIEVVREGFRSSSPNRLSNTDEKLIKQVQTDSNIPIPHCSDDEAVRNSIRPRG
jgi:hypothetical protein